MDESSGQQEIREKTPNTIKDLVERFEKHLSSYKGQGYNEAQLRQEFINPFFEALGWDVYNKSGAAPIYRDVIHEDAIKMGGGVKAPDYCFTLSGKRMFFVETKKPSVDIIKDAHPAYQLRRYSWSAELPLSILTNFEEFAIYESRQKPKQRDKTNIERTLLITYKNYIEKWDEIASIFSKKAVLQGSFDRYIELAKKKRGTQEVDDEFLKEIEGWRETLASNIAIRNTQLSVHELNDAVQKTIDRIIFLRMCEDRGIEQYGQLLSLLERENIYPHLCNIYEKADEKYNSGLFHFKKERERITQPDEITLKLIIDDKVLKDIIKHIYYPESPYEFSVLRPEILGNVYEQFLGKVIRLTEGHRAKVEEKPEVKKAGGVYYTPEYIVDYIVKNTVGKLCEGKTPKQMEKLHILDPACGSGSFLLGAYSYLLTYHLNYYTNKKNQKSYKEQIYQRKDGQWFLTIKEKKRILLNNIYGVDIDSQAVEVTKLSLLLKVLEGESKDVYEKQQKLWRERVLPDLGDNIKCGNSLIGPDFYCNFQSRLFEDSEMYRINAFDWNTEFKEIMDNGGFDAIIGNPPYIRIQVMKEWAPLEVEFYKQHYTSANKGNYDIYVVFVERGLNLLNNNGNFGFILPHKFFNTMYGEPLRQLLSEGKNLHKIVHFGHQQVFSGSTTYTCLLFLDKQKKNNFEFNMVDDLLEWRHDGQAKKGKISLTDVSSEEWNFVVDKEADLFNKLRKMKLKLGDVCDIFVGLQTSADDVFIMDLIEEKEKTLKLKSKALNIEWICEKGLLFPLISGTDVNRYCELRERQYIIFPYSIESKHVELIDWDILSKNYPKLSTYLMENKQILENREKGKVKGPRWYGYIYLKNMSRQSIKKICVPRLVEKLYATLDVSGNHFLDNVDVGGITLKSIYQEQGLFYILALLNSRVLQWYFPFVSAPFRGGWWSANRQFLSKLPIRTIDFSNTNDKTHHDKIVKLVEQMLDLNERLNRAKADVERMIFQRQIDAIDKQIDQLVYELYGLTDKEIKLVEESSFLKKD
jgi:type I restriction-modification system DNA methylase subunit